MKRIIKHFLILSFFLQIVSCKNEKTYDNKNEKLNISLNESKMIKEILNKQLKKGAKQYINEAGVELPQSDIEMDELEACMESESFLLSSNNFKTLTEIEFSNKIKLIFDRTIDFKSEKKLIFVNYFDVCDRKLNLSPVNNIDNKGIYISKTNKMIFDFHYLPEIIDYKSEYPKLYEEEKKYLKSFKNKNGSDCSTEYWYEITDLDSDRKINNQITINRNKYLFNDNNQSFIWLQKNDKYFLESLVKIFGYVKDKQLLEFVLNNQKFINNSNLEDISSLLWHKTCDKKLVFHKETLDLINEKKNKTEYFIFLNDEYLRFIDKSELPISQKAEIIANILNFIALNSEENLAFSNMGSFAQNFDGGRKTEGKYSKEFIKHNFYNLKNFKKQWEDAKVDGDGVAYPGNIE
ncbi:hypothetical protein EH230_01675 [Flavobacterium columnare]|uniref:Uncharacterized protein n=1 Tax=Flavobacterium columnare TaxID=996 RepID=A0A437UDN2_9FLAO|nr:hypothetical protein [Flavobacterium columnare]RVU91712.1 hypothetical protein EH230_01675 [Flavobacterium columnare]